MKAQTPAATSTRIAGQVSRLLLEKGFGFILATEGEAADYFFHLSDLQNTVIADLTLGDMVTFVPETSEKGNGRRARQVRLDA